MSVTTAIRNLVPKRKAALGVFLLISVCGTAWGVFSAMNFLADFNADINSLSVSEDNGIGAWRTILSIYTEEHGGRLPDAREREKLATVYKQSSSHFVLRCNMGAPYQWNPSLRHKSEHNAVPLVWCGKPHGLTHRWRNVMFSDLAVRRVPEDEFEALLRKLGTAGGPTISCTGQAAPGFVQFES